MFYNPAKKKGEIGWMLSKWTSVLGIILYFVLVISE